MKQTLGAIRKADEDWNLIQDGDRVCVGLSGGKDSLLLTQALCLYRKFSKKQFDLLAITVDLGLQPFDLSPVSAFCKSIDVPFTVVPTDIGEVVFDIRKESNPCSLCAKMRKGALYEETKKQGCNKIALGHHQDDLLDTFFMSMFFEGRLTALKPIFYLSRSDLTAIRPMIYLPEQHIIGLAKKLELPIVTSPCPANGNTKRDEIHQSIVALQRQYPQLKEKVFSAIEKDQNYQLWDQT